MSPWSESLRSLVRTPLFSGAAVVTFAFGIGVNLAVLAAIDRLLLRPLPYEAPEQLVMIWEYEGDSQTTGIPASFVLEARKASTVQELTLVNWDMFTFRMSSDSNARQLNFIRMASTALR